MNKVNTLLLNRESKNLQHQGLSGSQTPINNKRSLGRITSLSSPGTYQLSNEIGTFDTIRLTSTGVRPSQLKYIDTWTTGSGIRNIDLQSGEAYPQKRIIYIGSEGKETDRENSVTTIGLDHIPSRYNKKNVDMCIVNISSAPGLMGHPWSPLFQSEVPELIHRVQDIVSRYIDCDITTFNVSRLDSSTIFNVASPIRDYINTFDLMTRDKMGHSEKKNYENETIQFFNKSISVGFYDKAKKDKDKDVLIPEEFVNIKGLRYEVQNKKRSSVQSVYGGITFLDLCRDEMIFNCAKVRAKQFDRYWSMKDSAAYNEDYAKKDTVSDLFRAINKDAKKNVPHKTALAYLITTKTISVSQWGDMLRSEGYTPSYIRRFEKELGQLETISIEARNLHAEVYELIENDLKLVG